MTSSATARRAIGFAVALGAMVSAPGALAQSTPPQAQADALFSEGRELLEKGRYAEACAKLSKSEELAPAVGTLLNLAYCWEQAGRLKSALDAYSQAESLATSAGETKRAIFAKERYAAVEPRTTKLVIRPTAPDAPGLEVKRNGVALSAGTEAAAFRPDALLQPAFVPIGPARFTQGPDGVVLMSGPVVADPAPVPPAPTDCNCNSHERLQWVFPNAVATTPDTSQLFDHAVYVNPQMPAGTCHQCPLEYVRLPALATWIDKRTVLTAAAFGVLPEARTVTDVRVLARDPFDGYAKRRAQTKATDTPSGSFATDRIALTSSNGIGYLVLADGPGDDVSLSIFDPRCEAR